MAAMTFGADPILYVPDTRPTSAVPGTPLVGAQVFFYVAGSTTPLPVYTENTLTTAWTQPIVTNAAGQSDGPIYMTPTPAFKVLIQDADSNDLPGYPVDNLNPSAVAT
jgi:hypothetical protein